MRSICSSDRVTENGIIKYSLKNTWIQNQISWRSQLLKLRNCCASWVEYHNETSGHSCKYSSWLRGYFSYGNDNRESLRMRGRWKKKKLKEFNYKFHNNVSKIDEYEKNQLTRLGIDISNNRIIQIREFLLDRQQQRFTVAFKQLLFTWQRRLTNSNQNEIVKIYSIFGLFFLFRATRQFIVNYSKFL
jgi:hypothetical protein